MEPFQVDFGCISKARKVYVVMGNEAADLDSMASAVLYAYLKSKVDQDLSHLYIPYAPISKEDFQIRFESVYLFKEAGVGQESLAFQGEIDLQRLQEEGRLALILMDHNKLGEEFVTFEGVVEEIIDHHKDEGSHPYARVRNIESVGSTCTLVAEEFFRLAPQLVSPREALLLLGTILLDTVNLDPKAGRVTPKDVEVAGKLKPFVNLEPNTLFETLRRKKFNVDALQTADLLRKDYKEYTAGKVRYGISTVHVSLESWMKKDPHLWQELEKYRKDRKLNLLMVMISYTEPKFQRELLLVAELPNLITSFVQYLNTKGAQLTSLGYPGGYRQGNAEYSRKKIQPLVQEFLERLVWMGTSQKMAK